MQKYSQFADSRKLISYVITLRRYTVCPISVLRVIMITLRYIMNYFFYRSRIYYLLFYYYFQGYAENRSRPVPTHARVCIIYTHIKGVIYKNLRYNNNKIIKKCVRSFRFQKLPVDNRHYKIIIKKKTPLKDL